MARALTAVPVEQGLAIVAAQSGRLVVLNETAASLWQAWNEQGSLELAGELLARRYAVPPAQVRADAAAAVAAWAAAGLLPAAHALPDEPVEDDRWPFAGEWRRWTLALGPRTVELRCSDPALAALLATLCAPAATCNRPGPVGRVEIADDDDGFWVRSSMRRPQGPFARDIARQVALGCLIEEAHGGAAALPILHGAAIATPEGAWLLCGASGSGKSTLVAALVAAGYPLIADDILPLAEEPRGVWPVPFALSVKQGSWPVLAGRFPELEHARTFTAGERQVRYLWPRPGAVVPVDRPVPVAGILFPHYEPGTAVEVQLLRPLQALALLTQSGSRLGVEPEKVEPLVAWLGSLPAFDVALDALDEAVSWLDQLIGPPG